MKYAPYIIMATLKSPFLQLHILFQVSNRIGSIGVEVLVKTVVILEVIVCTFKSCLLIVVKT